MAQETFQVRKQQAQYRALRRYSCDAVEIIDQRLLNGLPPGPAFSELREALQTCLDKCAAINRKAVNATR